MRARGTHGRPGTCETDFTLETVEGAIFGQERFFFVQRGREDGLWHGLGDAFRGWNVVRFDHLLPFSLHLSVCSLVVFELVLQLVQRLDDARALLCKRREKVSRPTRANVLFRCVQLDK